MKAVVLKVAKPAIDAAVSFALPKLARLWEEQTWKKHGLAEGWFRVIVPPNGGPLRTEAGIPDSNERNLLLIHGTFSNAVSAYGPLMQTNFFTTAASLYGNRIYAFNHFTVSRSPQENVQALLSALPDLKQTFDVVTHSRGGLVLRTLVERAADFGSVATRFNLGRAVLVASPNDGTPLATPGRWDKTIGWVANLLKIIERFSPDNPFITGADFVAEGIVWLAHHVSGDLPGLRAMDAAGETIESLQGPPAPPSNAYSALVANFQPDQAIWQKMIDAGVDQFFGSANDLVVPSEGGWRIDRDGAQHVDPKCVGCFGPGGNLAPGETSAVMHTNFFRRRETAAFLASALAGRPQNLPVLNLDAPLPDRRFLRGVTPMPGTSPQIGGRFLEAKEAPGGPSFSVPTTAARDTFHIVILESNRATKQADGRSEGPPEALIYAAYGGARVVEPFELRGGTAGEQWRRIISLHERIKKFTDRQQGSLPAVPEIVEYGKLLFQVLFPGDVQRLYDTARSLQRDRTLDLVFTSMISWVAEKPWEFAYDSGRGTYLATEDIHFVRQVLTQIPGDACEARPGPLRILVVSAQPPRFAKLSIEEETELIRRDFKALTEAGLAQIDILPRATIAALHGYMSTANYSVVHFIGHGTFENNEGYLIFHGAGDGEQRLDQRSAREIFCRRGLSLVFLNSCQSGESSPADFNKGLAQALVAHGLPALVANQYSVSDSAATSFAQFFYWGLARGMSLGAAAREARIAVNYCLDGPAIDWAVPVLYARDPNSSLTISSSTSPSVMPVGAASAAARRAAADDRIHVAVWDVDHVLPQLQTTLNALNNAQACFVFDAVNLSAPLDAFMTTGGVHYVCADRVADRLKGQAVELGVKFLLCITHFPLIDSDGKEKGFYTWWLKDSNSPVLILSYAGFDEFRPSSQDTHRALTNAIVRALAGAQSGLELHDKGPVNCPMFRNAKNDFNIVRAQQRFDAQCYKALKADGGTRPALEALLSLFDKRLASRRLVKKRSKA